MSEPNSTFSKVYGKAKDMALYFKATQGPVYEQGLLLWVMCPTVGLDPEERSRHCAAAANKVLTTLDDQRIEYVGKGMVGLVVNEGYFERGCTWKDLTFEPIKLTKAFAEAYGVVLDVEEIPAKLVQIGTFPENSLEFANRAGPVSNAVTVNIQNLLDTGRSCLAER